MSNRLSRRGMVMVAALVIISLVAVSAAICARQHLLVRRQVIREGYGRQAQWLANGALERAHAALAKDDAWTGETWTAQIEAPGGESFTGEAVIQVTSPDDAPQSKTILIDARFPLDPILGVRHELSIPFQPEPSP